MVMMSLAHEKDNNHGDYDCKRPSQRNADNGTCMMRESILIGTGIIGRENTSLNDGAMGYR